MEADGVRVQIAPERNPMPAGEWTRMTTIVSNTGRDVLSWFHDGCAISVSAWGVMSGIEWRPGAEQQGVMATFKDRVLDIAYNPNPPRSPIVDFVPEKWAGQGSFGCADIGITDLVKPGETIRQTLVWTGLANSRWGPPPSGPVTLTGTFASYWRGREMPGDITGREIKVTLDAWVDGGVDETWLSPPEVVDAALADRAFNVWLQTQDLGNGRDEILWYEPQGSVWEVGVLAWYDATEPQLHLLLIDPHTGDVLDTVDRPWDEAADGFP